MPLLLTFCVKVLLGRQLLVAVAVTTALLTACISLQHSCWLSLICARVAYYCDIAVEYCCRGHPWAQECGLLFARPSHCLSVTKVFMSRFHFVFKWADSLRKTASSSFPGLQSWSTWDSSWAQAVHCALLHAKISAPHAKQQCVLSCKNQTHANTMLSVVNVYFTATICGGGKI